MEGRRRCWARLPMSRGKDPHLPKPCRYGAPSVETWATGFEEDMGLLKRIADLRWTIPVAQAFVAAWILRSWYAGKIPERTLWVRICFGLNAPVVPLRDAVPGFQYSTSQILGIAIGDWLTVVIPVFVLWIVVAREAHLFRNRQAHCSVLALVTKALLCLAVGSLVLRTFIADFVADHRFSLVNEALIPEFLAVLWVLGLFGVAMYYCVGVVRRGTKVKVQA